jgi:uncharacterized protein (DUF1778 family)
VGGLIHAALVAARSEQLQIRVTPAEKATLRKLARQAGLDLSTYVLTRVLPPARARVSAIVRALRDDEDHRFPLAELHDLVAGLPRAAFLDTLSDVELDGLSPFLQNYVAAMVEHAAHTKGERSPAWTRDVRPLEEPYFAAPFPRLRPYLLRCAPVAFKRRQLFVDATVGDRV